MSWQNRVRTPAICGLVEKLLQEGGAAGTDDDLVLMAQSMRSKVKPEDKWELQGETDTASSRDSICKVSDCASRRASNARRYGFNTPCQAGFFRLLAVYAVFPADLLQVRKI